MFMAISMYQVKGWNGKTWEYIGFKYLDSDDSKDKKEKVLYELQKEYPKLTAFNISNFFNVYL